MWGSPYGAQRTLAGRIAWYSGQFVSRMISAGSPSVGRGCSIGLRCDGAFLRAGPPRARVESSDVIPTTGGHQDSMLWYAGNNADCGLTLAKLLGLPENRAGRSMTSPTGFAAGSSPPHTCSLLDARRMTARMDFWLVSEVKEHALSMRVGAAADVAGRDALPLSEIGLSSCDGGSGWRSCVGRRDVGAGKRACSR